MCSTAGSIKSVLSGRRLWSVAQRSLNYCCIWSVQSHPPASSVLYVFSPHCIHKQLTAFQERELCPTYASLLWWCGSGWWSQRTDADILLSGNDCTLNSLSVVRQLLLSSYTAAIQLTAISCCTPLLGCFIADSLNDLLKVHAILISAVLLINNWLITASRKHYPNFVEGRM